MANLIQSFTTIKSLLKKIDLQKVQQLSKKIDLNEMMGIVAKMSEEDLAKMMKMMKSGTDKKKTAPEIDGDFYGLGSTLTPEEREIQLQVREDRKSTRLNSSHVKTSYAVFCLKTHENV